MFSTLLNLSIYPFGVKIESYSLFRSKSLSIQRETCQQGNTTMNNQGCFCDVEAIVSSIINLTTYIYVQVKM